MVAYNEADVLGASLRALVEQGCDASSSTTAPRTARPRSPRVARARRGRRRALRGRRFPLDSGRMVWADLLRRRAQVVREHDYDWYVLNDADEFRESPWPGLTFAEGLAKAERMGFNAVNFRVLNFRPTGDGASSRATIRARPHRTSSPATRVDAPQVKAFKRPASGELDIVRSGGHDIRFDGRRVCPIPFILRHYPIRSPGARPPQGARRAPAALRRRGARGRLARPVRRARRERRGVHVGADELVAVGPRRGPRGAARPRARPAAAGDDACAATTSAGWRSTTSALKARVETRVGAAGDARRVRGRPPCLPRRRARRGHRRRRGRRGRGRRARARDAAGAGRARSRSSGDPIALAHAKARLAAFGDGDLRPPGRPRGRALVRRRSCDAEELLARARRSPALFAGAFDASLGRDARDPRPGLERHAGGRAARARRSPRRARRRRRRPTRWR